DISVQSQILNLLFDLRQRLGVNYLMISHDLCVVRFLCDYIYILYNGRIVERGETSEIFGEPQHPYTKELIDASDIKTDNQHLFNQDVSDDKAAGKGLCPFRRCRRYSECGGEKAEERKITETHSVFCNL
ncbi:MAG: ABC transporter ATP-binding protein, partial [Deltaproteobacteria bacterium]|nr:ABC transporter ATP-binding protein [Deltaproteobacteria bacterium]